MAEHPWEHPWSCDRKSHPCTSKETGDRERVRVSSKVPLPGKPEEAFVGETCVVLRMFLLFTSLHSSTAVEAVL